MAPASTDRNPTTSGEKFEWEGPVHNLLLYEWHDSSEIFSTSATCLFKTEFEPDARLKHRPHSLPVRPFPEYALAEIASAEVFEALAHGWG